MVSKLAPSACGPTKIEEVTCRAAIYGVAQSRTRLKWLRSSRHAGRCRNHHPPSGYLLQQLQSSAASHHHIWPLRLLTPRHSTTYLGRRRQVALTNGNKQRAHMCFFLLERSSLSTLSCPQLIFSIFIDISKDAFFLSLRIPSLCGNSSI